MVAGLVVAGQLMAAPKLNQGTRELGVSGNLSDIEGGFEMNFDAQGGYFIMDNIEVGLDIGVTYMSTDAGGTDETFMMLFGGVFGEYNLPLTDLPVVPYIGAGAGIGFWSAEYGSADDSDVMFVGQGWAGAKYFLADSVSIGLQFEVDVASEDIYDGDSMDWKFLLRTSCYF